MKISKHILCVFALVMGMSAGQQLRAADKIETIIVGDITNELTGEVVKNANIYFQGTKVGTTSNEEGSFILRVELEKKHTLVVSAVGYYPQKYEVEPGVMAGIEVQLKERIAILPSITIHPGENPAISILNEMKLRKATNDRHALQLTQEVNTETEVYVSHIPKKYLRRQMWKQLEPGMTTHINENDTSYLLPVYRQTQTMEYRGNLTQYGEVQETQSLVLQSSEYSMLLNVDGNINFYNNTITILQRSFLSPLAPSGTLYYNYYLMDTLFFQSPNSQPQYIIHFRTKNAYYATFNGEMYVDTATLALRHIDARVPSRSNVRFLSDATISQDLGEDNSLQNEDIAMLMEFSLKDTTKRIFPTVLVKHRVKGGEGQQQNCLQDTTLKDTTNYAEAQDPFEALRDAPVVRVATWLGKIITTGYIPIGTYVDVGHIQEILQINNYETVHIGLPFRTNEKLMKNICLEANVAYGVRDKAWKGFGQIAFNLPTPRRNILKVSYRDHYAWTEVKDFTKLLRENSAGRQTMDFTAYALEAWHNNDNTYNTAARRRQIEIATENDWSEHIETQLYARIGWQGYGNPMQYKYYDMPYYRYQVVGGILRVGWRERKNDLYFRRIHAYSQFPVLYIGLEGGSWSEMSESNYHMYGKFNLMIRQNVRLGVGGVLDYAFQMGSVLGTVPYTLLHHFEGNQGYAYDPYRFTLMNNYQYAAKHFLALHLQWDGRGIFFNMIPGIRYLGMHELITFKVAWGNLITNNVLDDQVGDPYSHSLNTPYIEIGCGIGKILRIIDLHSVWRLTNREDTSTPLWALRFRLHFGQ